MQYFTQFQYLERPGVPRTTYLTNAHWPSTPLTQSGTDDPIWKIIRPDGSIGQRDELEYWGTDGRIWYCRVHAEYIGARHSVKIWLSHHAEDGTEHGDSIRFAIRDWNNKPIELEINEWVQNDSAPNFRIWK